MRRKTMARQHKAEVMIAGEQLLRLHDGKLIKDRRYHLRTYPNCFVAQELIDWLVSHKEAMDRVTAVSLMQNLMDNDIIHHCDKRPVFKDAKLLYRFRKDDGTFPFNTEVKIFMRGQQLYELIADKNSIMMLREEHGVSFQRCFPGYLFIDWLLQNGEVESRCQGLELCRALLEHGIIQHTKKHDFFDSGLLYQFCINFRRRRRLAELLNEGKQDEEGTSSSSQEDSPFILKKGLPSEHTAFQSVIGDPLGWGFVVRGAAPCYVQAVDPGSPAAAAGVKVRQFVCRVNEKTVLYLDYKTVTRLVMTGPRVVVLEVMEPLD
uniref:Si:dkeyp-97e7.9 n=1 Tax=Oryzias latipes TaxID=8090 RepID=A0A3P9ML05_ORYLA